MSLFRVYVYGEINVKIEKEKLTATCEIVLSERSVTSNKLFNVFFFNPERNTLQHVEIQGLGAGLKYSGTVYILLTM